MARLTENLNLQRGLLRHLKTHPEIELIDKTKVESIIRDEEEGKWPLVKLANDRILRTRLLVSGQPYFPSWSMADVTLLRSVRTGSTHLSVGMLEFHHTDGLTTLKPL